MIENSQQPPVLPVIPPFSAKKLAPALYLVATPIGNMADITLRALETLAMADYIACEDTRQSGKLLNYYGIKKPLLPYHDHNADDMRPKIMALIQGGASVALISDAGMPLISDPGFKLVREMAAAGMHITSMPGANAPLTALQLSALPGDGFAFLGFLPQKTKARQEKLNAFRQSPLSIILFESANRVEETIADIEAILGPRAIALARELTKMFEEVIRGTTTEVLQKLKTHSNVKGEMVLVISGAEDTALNSADIETLMLNALKEMKIKDAAKYVAEITGRPKSEVYDLALQLKNRTDA